VRELIDKARPKAVVAWVHNGDSRGALHMPQLHPNTHVFTLSPHVSKYVGNVLQVRLGRCCAWAPLVRVFV
jgi:hypothetical protein